MSKQMRLGKASEMIVLGELLRRGLDVYMPAVDDRAVDMIIRVEGPRGVRHIEVQVKSSKGHNRIIGVYPKSVMAKNGESILIVHHRYENRPDEFMYLTHKQVLGMLSDTSKVGDLMLNAPEREKYKEQDLWHLANRLLHDTD
jgi:predicted AAA+ superfamily ATPase